MKKPRKFDELSTRVCEIKGCHKRIKIRLVEKENQEEINKKFPLCYKHYKDIEFSRRSRGTQR